MQADPATGRVQSAYLLKDIKLVSLIDDDSLPNGFLVQRKHRIHLFSCEHRLKVIERMIVDAQQLIGVQIAEPQVELRSLEEILDSRHAVAYTDETAGSVKFDVYKRTLRHASPIPRRLCLSSDKMAELDAETGGLVSVHHMGTIFAIVSDPGEQQWFTLEFMDGSTRHYMSSTREALITCMLDACQAAGNHAVLHRLEETEPGWTYGPRWSLLEPSWESNYFHQNMQPQKRPDEDHLMKVLTEFSVQNLCDDKAAGSSILALFQAGLLSRADDPACVNLVIATLQTLQLLLQQTYGFLEFARAMEASGGADQLALCLRSDDEDMRFQATLVILRASVHHRERMQVSQEDSGFQIDRRDIRAAIHPEGSEGSKVPDAEISQSLQQNKMTIMGHTGLRKALFDALSAGLQSPSGHLVVKGIVDLMDVYLLRPGLSTTAAAHYDALLFNLGSLEGKLFALFFHPSTKVMKSAALLLEAITRDSTAEQAAAMQKIALLEGAFLKHLYTAIFALGQEARQLSRKLVAMFADNNERAIDTLRQTFPRGILYFLMRNSSDASAVAAAEYSTLEGPRSREQILKQKQEKKEMLKRVDESAAGVEDYAGQGTEYNNWERFWDAVQQDFDRGDLIWNQTTRDELRKYMELELAALGLDKQGAVMDKSISWNYHNFEVRYPSLLAEPLIGNLYLNKLLERRSRGEDVKARLLEEVKRDGNPERFVNWTFERFLLAHDDNTKATCLQVLTIIYKAHHSTLPVFRAMRDIVEMIDHTFSRRVRDSLLKLIQALLYEPLNAKAFMNANGVQVITELMSLVHWDDTLKIAAADLRDQQEVLRLEDSSIQVEPPATYWYYKVPKGFDDAGQELGPLSMSALDALWSKGLISGETAFHTKDDWEWKPLKSFRCLRWRFMMSGSSNESPVDVALSCMDIMLMLCSLFPVKDIHGTKMLPLSRARVLLSDMKTVLPHVVQILMTQHPKLIESASILIKLIVDENEELVRKLYRTGLFCFAFMYKGSNVLPLAMLVKETHDRQQFQGYEDALQMSESNVVKRSILSTIFPDSLVLYVHNRSPHDFVKTYLGENDTPELIWTQGMRDKLMTELAQHTSDFSWQLREYPMSVYDYEPVPAIGFPELKEEVWLHTVYLKNLADTKRFAMWVIDEPVPFLRALLDYWRKLMKGGIDKLNNQEAYTLLGADRSTTPAELKKLYRKLAIKFHPDKNPDGQEMFQKINEAYEHLTKNQGVGEEKKTPHGIKLILSAHVVLFRQHGETLSPYKYAGYDLLLRVMSDILKTDDIFSAEDSVEIMSAALATILLTIRSSPANGEEFCRRAGVGLLEQIISRCADVLTASTSAQDTAFVYATEAVRIFTLLMQDVNFLRNSDVYHNQALQPTELGQNRTVRTLVNFVRFQQHSPLVRHAIACVDAMCQQQQLKEESILQGVLWHLIPLLFWHDTARSEATIVLDTEDEKYVPHDPTDVNESDGLTELKRKDAIAREACRALLRLGGWMDSAVAPTVSAPLQDLELASLTSYYQRHDVDKTAEQVQSLLVSRRAGQTHLTPTQWEELSTALADKYGDAPDNPRVVPVSAVDGSSHESAMSGCALAQNLLLSLLGPWLIKRMLDSGDALMHSADKPVPFLSLLNSYQSTPELIWSANHQTELVNFCAKQADDFDQDVWDKQATNEFVYQETCNELQIYGIFVKNLIDRTRMDGYHTDVEDPTPYLQTVLSWLKDDTSVQSTLQHPTRGTHTVDTVAIALQSVIDMVTHDKSYASSIPQCSATVPLFTFVMPGKLSAHVNELAIAALKAGVSVPTAIDQIIKDSDCLTPLMCILKGGTQANKSSALKLLSDIVQNPRLLVDVVQRGAVLYLLALTSSPDAMSERAREVLQQMAKSALHGLKVTEAMEQFLPPAVISGVVNDLGEDEFRFTMVRYSPDISRSRS